MSTDFRRDVFNICNKLLKDETAKQIKEVIFNLSKGSVDEESNINSGIHSDFGYVARNSNSQFHGYLFVDDGMDNIEFPAYLKVEHLTENERKLIERGHKTIIFFIDRCLEDISKKSSKVADAINPYYLFKNVSVRNETIPLLTNEDMEQAVTSFKNGSAYRALLNSDIIKLYDSIRDNDLQMLISTINTDFKKNYTDSTQSDLKDFSVRVLQKSTDMKDHMFSFGVLMYALKESLRISSQLIFDAIIGKDLTVLNNDNIIKIEKDSKNTIFSYYKILVQGACFFDSIGGLILMDCDEYKNRHVHQFGMLTEITTSMITEFGDTTKFTFLTVNEELIPIQTLIDTIINSEFPKLRINKA